MFRRFGLGPVVRDNRRVVLGALLAGVSIGALFAPHSASAQTVSPTPGVVVDLGVLENLGQPQTVPDLLYPNDVPGSRLHILLSSETAQPKVRPTRRARVEPLRKPEDALALLPTTDPQRAEAPVPAKPLLPAAQMPPTPDTATAAADPGPTAIAPPTPPAAVTAPVAAADPVEEIEATPAPASVAAIPPQEPPSLSPKKSRPEEITIVFSEDDTAVPPEGSGQLAGLAEILTTDPTVQVQVFAYAGGGKDTGSRARRVSLSRALSVRSYLMDQGITSTRIEVRALGNQAPGDNPDRVDIKLVRQ